MKKKVYLDVCTFNRPFDSQADIRVRLETEAKLEIQTKITEEEIELVWSYVMDFENRANPFDERREAIEKWQKRASLDVGESPSILKKAELITKNGIRSKDALHIACAVEAGCEYFLTTDDGILNKMKDDTSILVLNPVDFLLGEQT